MKTKSDCGVHMSTKSMNAIFADKLKSEITSHQKCANLANIDHVIIYFINGLNYMWNTEHERFAFHYREGDIMVIDPRSVHEQIDGMASDPELSCLLTPRRDTERYVRPSRNPWLPGDWFSLKQQGIVLNHEPALAQKWRLEAQTQKMA